MSKMEKGMPRAVVSRLTRYLSHVQGLRAVGAEWISSQEMADALDVTSSTVRQDLSHLDFSGTSKRGYAVEGLCGVLLRTLGADRDWATVVVGAGNLGRALALHEEFPRRGFRICGIVDVDPSKIGLRIGVLTVARLRDLPRLVKRENAAIGVLAVPFEAAQEACDMLVVSGIRGVLNMTMHHVVVPRGVAVNDSRIVAHLLELTHDIRLQG